MVINHLLVTELDLLTMLMVGFLWRMDLCDAWIVVWYRPSNKFVFQVWVKWRIHHFWDFCVLFIYWAVAVAIEETFVFGPHNISNEVTSHQPPWEQSFIDEPFSHYSCVCVYAGENVRPYVWTLMCNVSFYSDALQNCIFLIVLYSLHFLHTRINPEVCLAKVHF